MRRILLLAAAIAFVPVAAAAPPRKGLFAPGKSLGGLRLGMTPAQVKAAWGADYGRCRGCPQPTWYYTYRRYHPHGAAVQFRRGRVQAIFTLWAPSGWKTTKGLYIGDNVTHLQTLYGTLARDAADDAAAELRAPVRVLEVDRRDRDARVALEVPRLPASRLGEEDDVAALDADPDRHRVRGAVRQRGREVGEVARLEDLAHLRRKGHGQALTGSAAPGARHETSGAISPVWPFRRR